MPGISDERSLLAKVIGDVCRRPPKIIIYSNFQTAFTRIVDYLNMKEIPFASLVKSSMSMKKRAEAMEAFKENPDIPVFLLVRKDLVQSQLSLVHDAPHGAQCWPA